MTEFVYNKAKKTSTNHTLFELICGYYSHILFGENVNPYSKSKSVDKLFVKSRELKTVCQENLFHTQKFSKQAYEKGIKPKSYTLNNKVWLNGKYIKTKQNRKLKAKFFKLFHILYFVAKQVYKLEFSRK